MLSPFILFPPIGGGVPMNWAASANGGIASASSVTGGGGGAATFGAERANNGYRHTNNNWNSIGAGSGWNGSSSSSDWWQVVLVAPKVITEVNIFTLHDNINYDSSLTIDLTTTFTSYGVTGYDIKYWDGAAWQTFVSVTGNDKVWRQWMPSIPSADIFRVYCTSVLASEPRLIEVELIGI